MLYHDESKYFLRIWSQRYNMFVDGCESLCAKTICLQDAIAFWEKKYPEKRIRIDLSPQKSGEDYNILYESTKAHQFSLFNSI